MAKHGRLIDADALFANLDGMMAVSPTGYIHGDTVADMIGDAPTIEPERKMGKWLRYGEDGNPNEVDTTTWQCDQCLETYYGRTTRIPNFCPACGADMRGEE